jgi:serine/threonine-protein kinase
MASVATAAEVPREGDIIADKYRVERVLGMGGMGVVVAARHVRLDERVALKFLLPNATMNAEVVARFEREARAASKIKNEHVARVTDVATLPNGSPYMVMEYLEGGDLSAWLEQHGQLRLDLAVDFLLQACEAICEAHTLGIVHRDLKPANLFCVHRTDGAPLVKVLDFGISKLSTPGSTGASSNMTKTTAFLGSPLYMSPEQLQASKGVDARTDIWSLGVILFELLCRKTPFDADSVTELVIKIATEPPPPLRALRPDAPPGLELVVARCLEKDRARRFQSVGELAMALAEFAPPQARPSVDRIVGTERRSGIYAGWNVSSAVQPAPAMAPMPVPPGVAAPSGPSGTAMLATAPGTAASWGRTGGASRPPPAPSTAKGWVAAIAGAGVLAAAVTTAGLLYRSAGTTASVAAAAAPAVTTAPPTTPPAAAPPASSPPPTAAAAPAASSTATATPAPPAPPPPAAAPPSAPFPHAGAAATSPAAHATPHANPAPAAVPPTTPKAAPKGNCTPPYTVDATGEHHYKPECL